MFLYVEIGGFPYECYAIKKEMFFKCTLYTHKNAVNFWILFRGCLNSFIYFLPNNFINHWYNTQTWRN